MGDPRKAPLKVIVKMRQEIQKREEGEEFTDGRKEQAGMDEEAWQALGMAQLLRSVSRAFPLLV